MQVCFVCREKVSDFLEKQKENKAQLYLFGFNGMEEVSYERELKGETRFFEDAALLSKTEKSIVVCGCITDTVGHKRKSAVVAENGRLMGVSDTLHAIDGTTGCGATLRIYDTKIGKMGVVVADDIYFPDNFRSLAVCGADFIVCPFEKVKNTLPAVLLRAHAYSYGVPVLFCGMGQAMAVNVGGMVEFSSPNSPAFYNFENRKEYHLIETRRRGFTTLNT